VHKLVNQRCFNGVFFFFFLFLTGFTLSLVLGYFFCLFASYSLGFDYSKIHDPWPFFHNPSVSWPNCQWYVIIARVNDLWPSMFVK
jgi:hypothetical protein